VAARFWIVVESIVIELPACHAANVARLRAASLTDRIRSSLVPGTGGLDGPREIEPGAAGAGLDAFDAPTVPFTTNVAPPAAIASDCGCHSASTVIPKSV